MNKEIRISTGFILRDVNDRDNYGIFHDNEQEGKKLLGWISKKVVIYEMEKSKG